MKTCTYCGGINNDTAVACAGCGKPLSDGMAQPTIADQSGSEIRIEGSLLSRAKQNDREAVQTLFRQFIPPDEEVLFCEYFGVQGLWWVGVHSFACLTNRRVASIRVGPWGEVLFQDGLLEHHNSGIVHQPGLLGLYIVATLYIIFAVVFTLGIGLLLFPYIVQWFYRVNKCGLVWIIREGVSVYLFSNRKKLTRANQLYRLASEQHDRRLATLPHVARLA